MAKIRWSARRRAALALLTFDMLVLIVLWTLQPHYEATWGAYAHNIIFFCIILGFASVVLARGRPIFRS